MIEWRPINSAPKDEKPKLLFARFKIIPDDKPGPVVGRWHKAIERWKVVPDHLDNGDELFPTHWAELTTP